MFYRRKSEKELYTRYLDTYLSKYDSVLPPHYLRERADGTVEEVPIPPTHPEKCPPALRGVKVRDGKGISVRVGYFFRERARVWCGTAKVSGSRWRFCSEAASMCAMGKN